MGLNWTPTPVVELKCPLKAVVVVSWSLSQNQHNVAKENVVGQRTAGRGAKCLFLLLMFVNRYESNKRLLINLTGASHDQGLQGCEASLILLQRLQVRSHHGIMSRLVLRFHTGTTINAGERNTQSTYCGVFKSSG